MIRKRKPSDICSYTFLSRSRLAFMISSVQALRCTPCMLARCWHSAALVAKKYLLVNLAHMVWRRQKDAPRRTNSSQILRVHIQGMCSEEIEKAACSEMQRGGCVVVGEQQGALRTLPGLKIKSFLSSRPARCKPAQALIASRIKNASTSGGSKTFARCASCLKIHSSSTSSRCVKVVNSGRTRQ
eukprot:1005815-Amphidinium_carterae.1